ncbi:DUF5333 family protein [Celeribacter litoreus]|uniref:DUF5333 family protein n=1 Tax=Celeribacter litoreus TaxID=2876714 RepID=UPI001CCC4723|nr:DUF5333 family protein [Celeribacter litoreus]MCA0045268.1 DUF5333 domain-containing protein [Celeribacter litoreus]
MTVRALHILAAAMLALPAHAAGSITEDPVVMNEVMLSTVATKIAAECPKYAVNPTATGASAQKLMGHISEQGYSSSEVQDLQSPAYMQTVSVAADEYLSAQGVDATNNRALCAFAKRELREGTSELSMLLMKNR